MAPLSPSQMLWLHCCFPFLTVLFSRQRHTKGGTFILRVYVQSVLVSSALSAGNVYIRGLGLEAFGDYWPKEEVAWPPCSADLQAGCIS